MKITVETIVDAPLSRVWESWTTPEDIMAWNAASDDWHTTSSVVDLRAGGVFLSRMEAKDGSMGFDFTGTYNRVEPMGLIEATLDGRDMIVEFTEVEGGVLVRETFDAEEHNSEELQKAGWQAILDNFKRHTEG